MPSITFSNAVQWAILESLLGLDPDLSYQASFTLNKHKYHSKNIIYVSYRLHVSYPVALRQF